MKDDDVKFGAMVTDGYVRMMDSLPTGFRMVVYPDGREAIQGGYRWRSAHGTGIEWRDLPKVHVDADGVELSEKE